MVAGIIDAMDRIEADSAVGALVITGTAPAFCAGANLGNLAEATKESLGTIYEGFLRVARSPLPTIAAVNGAAVGAGMNLALGCDVRLAARRAKFDSRFLQIGIHPGGGHTWMLRRAVGPQATFASVVFGEVIDSAEAERIGLVHRCYDDDKLLAAAQEMAARAAAAPRELLIEMTGSSGAIKGKQIFGDFEFNVISPFFHQFPASIASGCCCACTTRAGSRPWRRAIASQASRVCRAG